MFARRTARSAVLAGAVVVLLSLAVAAPAPAADQVKTVIKKLSMPIDLEKGIDKDTPLQDALAFLSDRYDLTILIDVQAFKEEPQVKEIENTKVRLAKMKGIPLGTVLRLVLDQANSTALVRAGYVQIVPTHRAVREVYKGREGPYSPIVHAAFDKRPLEEVLEELAEQTGVSIVVDGRCEGATEPVTATLMNVPLDTAVRLLADMAGLRVVPLDNTLYVTSKENAQAMQVEHDRGRAEGPTPVLKEGKPAPARPEPRPVPAAPKK
jgi:hypothetical protein